MLKHEKSGIFDVINIIMLLLISIITIIPIIHILNLSFSTPSQTLSAPLLIWPRGFTWESYKFIFSTKALLKSFEVTIFITVVGTFLNLIFTVTAAYVLSKRDLPGLKFILILIVITMLLSGGIIPGYILIRNLGLIDSVWSMILPGMVSAFNLILMRNFFWSVPDSLTESARIDGAGELRTLVQIMIPLSLPAIATIGLFYGVAHWNEFFRGLFYLNDTSKWPLQLLLRGIISQADMNQIGAINPTASRDDSLNVLSVQAATIIATITPIVMVYPFLQKYFVKGIMLGSEKG